MNRAFVQDAPFIPESGLWVPIGLIKNILWKRAFCVFYIRDAFVIAWVALNILSFTDTNFVFKNKNPEKLLGIFKSLLLCVFWDSRLSTINGILKNVPKIFFQVFKFE